MMKYLFAAVFLASLTLGAGKLPVFNYTFSAKTMTDTRNPGINADPGFRKLTDGKINKDGSKVHYGRVVFRHIENGEKPVVITFNFRAPVKLSEARVHYFRGSGKLFLWPKRFLMQRTSLVPVAADVFPW